MILIWQFLCLSGIFLDEWNDRDEIVRWQSLQERMKVCSKTRNTLGKAIIYD